MTDAATILGPGGRLQELVPGYESRPGQLTMAAAVERALATDGVLICEAGTGTGKTLAYLIPAILSGRRVVISTATRALQDQLLNKDIPLAERALGRPTSAAVLKEVGNYVCRRRFADVDSARVSQSYRALRQFVDESETGDLSELMDGTGGERVAELVAASTDTRLGARCEHYDRCFVTWAKRRAEAAQVVIVNHHLFFADLALRGPHPGHVLPPYDAVIFDEAHRVEDIAAPFFGSRVSLRKLSLLAEDAKRWLPSRGLLSSRHVERAENAAAQLFECLLTLMGREPRLLLGPDHWQGACYQRYLDVDASFEHLELSAAVPSSEEYPNTAETEALRNLARRARQLRDELTSLVEGANGCVTWIERDGGPALCSTPVALAPILSERLFQQVPTLVFTSATLRGGEGETPFHFFKTRLGAQASPSEIAELVVDSPFDYKTHARLYAPRHLPSPASSAYGEAAIHEVRALLDAAAGGAFVLVTSFSMLRTFHAGLADCAHPLLVQGEAPKHVLLEAFREASNAVLLATMSFWEGVDVPGQALRLVIIDKLPFPVPTDPLFSARAAELEEQGGNPFRELALPTAQMTLQQGFGRLIRSRRDRGLVAVLDSRLQTKGYGRQLLSALPPAPVLDQLEDAIAFLRSLDPESNDDHH